MSLSDDAPEDSDPEADSETLPENTIRFSVQIEVDRTDDAETMQSLAVWLVENTVASEIARVSRKTPFVTANALLAAAAHLISRVAGTLVISMSESGKSPKEIEEGIERLHADLWDAVEAQLPMVTDLSMKALDRENPHRRRGAGPDSSVN